MNFKASIRKDSKAICMRRACLSAEEHWKAKSGTVKHWTASLRARSRTGRGLQSRISWNGWNGSPVKKRSRRKSGLILQSVFAGICRRQILPLRSRPLSSGMHSRNTSLISLRKMKYGVFLMRQTGTDQPEDRRTLRSRFRPLSGYSTDVGYAAMS